MEQIELQRAIEAILFAAGERIEITRLSAVLETDPDEIEKATDELANLYAAGRCISVTDAMWDITRSIPNCVVSGQAAGVAAALQGVSVQDIQSELTRQQVVLHFA